MNERSHPKAVEPQLTTNEKIRKLAEANPDLADALKSKFPEAVADEYVKFPVGFFDEIAGLMVLDGCASEAEVEPRQGIYALSNVEVILKPLSNGATAVLFKIKK